jgi:hypothetical protein
MMIQSPGMSTSGSLIEECILRGLRQAVITVTGNCAQARLVEVSTKGVVGKILTDASNHEEL